MVYFWISTKNTGGYENKISTTILILKSNIYNLIILLQFCYNFKKKKLNTKFKKKKKKNVPQSSLKKVQKRSIQGSEKFLNQGSKNIPHS